MLISPEYAELNRQLHLSRVVYGCSGMHYVDDAKVVIDRYGCESVLDYGCGKGTFKLALKTICDIPVHEYDPAIKGKDGPPEPADLVVCTDVMEHIEPDCLDAVLHHMCSLAKKAVFLQIATREATKCLPDGRNAHLIVQEARWWFDKIAPLVRIEEARADGRELLLIGVPL